MARIALVTGASRGLGKLVADELMRRGYGLVLNSAHRKITTGMGTEKVRTVYGDLSKSIVMDTLVAECAFMNVSVLVNNAGIYHSSSIRESDVTDWRRVIEVNLLVPMTLTLRLWPTLRKNGGTVVNINSLAGKTAGKGELAYSASKHGLRGFSSALQFEGTRDEVRVIEVYLGAMNTEMTTGRPSSEKFINPGDAAQTICALIESRCPSMSVTEVELRRRIY